jgi:phage-related protein
VGMLMYLAENTRPDIVYAVHQAARYTHDSRASHAVAIKRIMRYIKGTKDKGIYFKPDGT